MEQSKRAVGIIRVSQVNGREGESFASPEEQRERIAQACRAKGWKLLTVFEELDVSGGTALSQRSGLRAAVEAVEQGRAEVIIAAYFDRLVRSVRVQTEVVERVEAAGGDVHAVDFGAVTNGNATQRMTSHFLGAVAQYHRDITAEKSGAAQRRAVKRGVPPMMLPPGLRKVGGAVEVDPELAPIVAKAVRLRAEGAPVRAVRDFLAEHGIKRSYHGTTSLLKSRLLIGEIVFGANRRPEDVLRGTCPAVVDRATWDRAQRVSAPRGRKAKSDRLLARLGVLRCATCGSRMVVGTSNNSGYYLYRCPPTGDCKRRVTVSAELVEGLVVARVRTLLAGIEGTASSEQPVREAAAKLDHAQASLDAAIRAFTGLEGEETAVERLTELRQARDAAQERHERLVVTQTATSIAVTVGDWDRLALEERRDLIRAVIERVEVRPGRGADRVSIIERVA